MIKKYLPIKKILIANRSEVVPRINSTCSAMGIKTVAIYTKNDVLAPFPFETDEAYQLPGEGINGYMDGKAIIDIACTTGTDAIHPGYGFLSESSTFAQNVIDAGITWIGPKPSCIELMGNKIHARTHMKKTGIPVIPGIHCSDLDKNKAKQSTHKMGYPIIIKAACGGGGKAMRIVTSPHNFDSAWEGVIRESKALFKSTDIFIEKYITQGRHIEIQIASDGNNVIHLFERECTLQRRHQKVIEETPCTFVSQTTLEKMYNAACIATQSLNYDSIGTIEFMVTPDENFYFLEMNTRLQVEHPITELTTGIDLVALQIELAQTKKLSLAQKDISRKGHAIECRILAEDPKNNFIPSSGTIQHLQIPDGPFTRHDHSLEAGIDISPFFDSMLSKLITYGQTREQSRKHMIQALRKFSVAGIITNISFLQSILESKEFNNGTFDTQWLNTHAKQFQTNNSSNDEKEIAIIAAALWYNQFKSLQREKNKKVVNRWRDLQWR